MIVTIQSQSSCLPSLLLPTHTFTHIHQFAALSGSRSKYSQAPEPDRTGFLLLGKKYHSELFPRAFGLLACQVDLQGSDSACVGAPSSAEFCYETQRCSFSLPHVSGHSSCLCLCFSLTRGSYMTLNSWGSSQGLHMTSLTTSIPWMKTWSFTSR